MKKILILFALSLFWIIPVHAEILEIPRTESNHYGVNKKWEITSKNKNHILATPYVDASLKVYDYADILSDSEEKTIKSEIENFISKTRMDMVIVTIDKPYSIDSFHEEYAADFYDYNDFGIDFDKYSGVLLLRNAYTADPYFNVYMFGDAQLYYSYNRAERMLDRIYPAMKSKQYEEGFKLFISEYLNYYAEGIPEEMHYYSVDDMGYLQKNFKPPFLFAFFTSTAITSVVVSLSIRKNKMVKTAAKAQEYLNRESIYYNRREDKFISTHTSSYVVSSSTSSGGGGFSSSSGSSGGGHSSGGGRHG